MSDKIKRVRELIERLNVMYEEIWLPSRSELLKVIYEILSKGQEEDKAIEEGRKVVTKYEPAFVDFLKRLVDEYGLPLIMEVMGHSLLEAARLLYLSEDTLLLAKSRRKRAQLCDMIDDVGEIVDFYGYLTILLAKILRGDEP